MNEVFYVIGGTGHIGNNVVRELLKMNKCVRVLIKNKSKSKYIPDGAEVFIGDILKKDSLEEFFKRDKKKLVYVIDCINNFSLDETVNFNKCHVAGMKNVIELCEVNKVDKYVYLSSMFAYMPNEIITSYGKSKQNAEKFVLDSKSNINASIAVAPLVYGPNDYNSSVVNKMFYNVFSENKNKCLDACVYLESVSDVAKGVINTALYGKNGETYFLGAKKKSSRDILNEFGKVCEVKKNAKFKKIDKLIKYDNLINKMWEIKKIKPLYSKNFLLCLKHDISKKYFAPAKDIVVKSKNIHESLKETKNFFENL